VAQGTGSSGGRLPRAARGRPNWWVILAVSLALMALLVATAGDPKRVAHGAGTHGIANAQSSDAHGTRRAGGAGGAGGSGGASGSVRSTATTTTASVPAANTAATSLPLGSGSHQGVLEPPAQRSSSVGFTGTGAMQVSVVWSGPTYLTMQVSCPSGTQNVGGSSAMAASLPDASGSCLATVSEPTSESTALTYTITIGPAGG